MGAKKPRVVIIGAGMAGLTAAHRLYTCAGSRDLLELCVVEGGTRIGGRINTSEFGGDRIEMGATWIHGIGGSPVHQFAQQIHALDSDQPWECMDGFLDVSKTVAEGGLEVSPCVVEPISTLFKLLMDFAQGKHLEDGASSEERELHNLAAEAFKVCKSNNGGKVLSIGSFLRQGLETYRDVVKDRDEEVQGGHGNWRRRSLKEAIFAMHENTQRTYTSAGDLSILDFSAESEYRMFPGEEITIARGYSSIIESLASVLPDGLIQVGRKVRRIEWHPEVHQGMILGNGHSNDRPVKLHFCDDSVMSADHVIVTVSLGVLKAGISEDLGLFSPPLPTFKTQAISRLGFGVVNKLFLQLDPAHDPKGNCFDNFPVLQMAFHRSDSELRHEEIPWWMRRTASLCPIYHNSKVLLSWFAGEEALQLETLTDEEIIEGVSSTINCLLSQPEEPQVKSSTPELCNGNVNSVQRFVGSDMKFGKVLKSRWGTDPLFLGSYSYVAVGSSGDDLDTMAEPLPRESRETGTLPELQILFAGEATHRTHYSTTHGAYLSGIREANRLLQHYDCV
ncbi:probable polyamine oxidase 5 [Syzygium oleosum]|uniref:probable polyamine oxidase 5 n=1 Tax=Syzygium oleosum TaxID=219896 RepID=UPI0011D1AC07|nr:probable polyamine oxidase 5 [Syzygium oleosum]